MRNGKVTMAMSAGSEIEGYAKQDYVKQIQDDVQGQINAINNSKMYRVEIFTPDSQIIRDKNQEIKLSCKIYSWDQDVTTSYKSHIRWIRKSNNSTLDTLWNKQSIYRGVDSITITAADIADNASFHCEVDIPD